MLDRLQNLHLGGCIAGLPIVFKYAIGKGAIRIGI